MLTPGELLLRASLPLQATSVGLALAEQVVALDEDHVRALDELPVVLVGVCVGVAVKVAVGAGFAEAAYTLPTIVFAHSVR